MSYILDALKKAESERERGTVPSLRSQSVPFTGGAVGANANRTGLMLGAVALGLLLLVALVWRLFATQPTQVNTTGVVPASPAVSQIANSANAAATTAAPVTAVAAAPAAPSAPLPTEIVPVDQANKAEVVTAKPVPSARPVPERQPAPRTANAPNPPSLISRSDPITTSIVSINDLAADIRQTLPKTVISGATYSDNPAQRLVIINGDVFREGDNPAPDLVLEKIRAKSVVLNFKGLRYSVGY